MLRPKLIVIVFAVLLNGPVLLAQSDRFIIDDDEYLDKVTTAGEKLLQAGKLKSIDSLRSQVHTKGYSLKIAPVAHEKLSPPDLCERLRASTLAVGTLYKCPDCSDWHFNSSAGFAVADGGVISTCCHVIQAQDESVKEGYLIAADSTGHVFPVHSVLAADTESDTCFLKIDASGLKPLPLRTSVRTGDRIYCLSHPGGYHFMFTEGMVARLNRRRDNAPDEEGHTNNLTRPVLFLNVTTEFAPGSSGAPIVDEAGNVLGQVASIADAGEPNAGDDHTPASPSVPVRFCIASEEILRLTHPELERKLSSKRPIATPKETPRVRSQASDKLQKPSSRQ